MYCEFQTPNGSSWVAFGTVLKPLKIKRTMAVSTQAAYDIELSFAAETTGLLPGQVTRLHFATDYDEYLVVVDGGKTSSHGAKSVYRHSYAVQELLATTREMHVQTAFFTGTSYATPSAFFTRLFAITDTSYVTALSLATSGAGYDQMVADWKQADYQVTSNSLLDNLVKIGMNNGVRFKASYTIQAPGAGTITLTAYKLTGDGAIASINGTIVADSTIYKGSNYAGKVSAVVSNVASDQFKWWPSYSFTDGARAEPSAPYATETTDDDICLVLSHNIRDCSSLRVMGFRSALVTDYAAPEEANPYYKYFDTEGTEIVADEADPATHYVFWDDAPSAQTERNDGGNVDTFNVVEYAEWLLLEATGTGSQADTLYFKRGENKIYNIKICTEFGTAGWVYQKKIYNSSWVYQSSVYRYQYMKLHLNYYSAYVNLYDEGELVMQNTVAKQANTTISFRAEKRTAFYSQEENQAAGKALAQNMQGYIDSMNNSEYEASYVFTAYTDLPTLDGIYNGMVLYEMDLDINQSYIAANLKFSDDLVPKSEYLSADGGINLPEIPLDKAYDRFTNYQTQMWMCRSLADAQSIKNAFALSIYFDHAEYADNIMKAFDNGTELAPLAFEEALLKMGDNPYVYTALSVHSCALGNSVIVNFRTVDNRIAGRMVDDSTTTNSATLKFYPINFIEGDGICTAAEFKLVTPSVRYAETNYPAITSATYNAATDLVTVADASYYHDKAERPNIMYQLVGKVYNSGTSGKLCQAFWEESCFFRDTAFTGDPYTRYATIEGFDYEIDVTSVTTTVTSGIYRVRITLESACSLDDGEYLVTFMRKLNTSPYTEETMLVTYGALTNASPHDYIDIYVVFTK